MLALRMAPVGLEHHRHGGQAVAVAVAHRRPEPEQEGHPLGALGLGRPHQSVGRGTGTHGVELAGRLELALQTRTVERELQIDGATLAQHGDDPRRAPGWRRRTWAGPSFPARPGRPREAERDAA